jgi:hypothetical protein
MAAKHREKDQAMAAALKAAGVVRDHARCPMCHAVVKLDALPVHIQMHPASS